MCEQCRHIRKEIDRLEKRLKGLPCEHKPRRGYYKEYYAANREKKLDAAKNRYREKVKEPELF